MATYAFGVGSTLSKRLDIHLRLPVSGAEGRVLPEERVIRPVRESPVQDFFIRQNIGRYRKLLETALDENERTRAANLLAREMTRLAQYLSSSGHQADADRSKPDVGRTPLLHQQSASMDRFVILHNIQRYRTMLTLTGDDATRRRIAALLAEEEAKLARLPPSSARTEVPTPTRRP